jgi:hypothetical protein
VYRSAGHIAQSGNNVAVVMYLHLLTVCDHIIGIVQQDLTGVKNGINQCTAFNLERKIFYFKFTGNLLLPLQKNGFNCLSQKLWLIHFHRAPAANN